MLMALETMENNGSHMTYVIKLSCDMWYTRSIHRCISWACSIIHWRVWEKYLTPMILKSGLLIDNRSSMYPYVKLKWDVSCLLSFESKDCSHSASCEYRNMSVRRGAKSVAVGMPTICVKTFPPKTMKILSTRNTSMLMRSSSVYLFFDTECSLTKYGPARTKTKHLYLRFSFLWMQE